MTVLGQATHLALARRMATSRTIKGGQWSRDNTRYLSGLHRPQEEFDDVRIGSLASPPQKFSIGFVDFLLGRGGR